LRVHFEERTAKFTKNFFRKRDLNDFRGNGEGRTLGAEHFEFINAPREGEGKGREYDG